MKAIPKCGKYKNVLNEKSCLIRLMNVDHARIGTGENTCMRYSWKSFSIKSSLMQNIQNFTVSTSYTFILLKYIKADLNLQSIVHK